MTNDSTLARSLVEQVTTVGSLIASCYRANGHPEPRVTIHSVVLEHGVGRHCARDRWPGVRRGRPKLCYTNAARLVVSDPTRWVYCEGFAIRPSLGIVVGDHAFCLDAANDYELVDPTWRDTRGAAYLGVPFAYSYLRDQLIATRMCGLLDAPWSRWPVLNTPSSIWLHPDAGSIPRDFTVPADQQRTLT
jgi:hypothetical protein